MQVTIYILRILKWSVICSFKNGLTIKSLQIK